MAWRFRKRVKRTSGGRFSIRLADEERTLLRNLSDEVRGLLTTDEPSLRRLFPPAYLDDPEKDAEYQSLMRADLLARHEAALTTLEKTADATEVDEAELTAWMSALNQVRLVLGTSLDVSEETDLDVDRDDPRAFSYAVYGFLGYLQEEVVSALAGW
jgi:hypothetical protein